MMSQHNSDALYSLACLVSSKAVNQFLCDYDSAKLSTQEIHHPELDIDLLADEVDKIAKQNPTSRFNQSLEVFSLALRLRSPEAATCIAQIIQHQHPLLSAKLYLSALIHFRRQSTILLSNESAFLENNVKQFFHLAHQLHLTIPQPIVCDPVVLDTVTRFFGSSAVENNQITFHNTPTSANQTVEVMA
ncbi:MAG: hypothetical protein KIT27_01225 [Legionellales bacterium]|nr:hypothetical protein [Legionellales bacterium]